MAHGLDVILDVAEMLRDREDIVFLTAGDGAERAQLQSELERRGVQIVKMLGQLPKEQMPALWPATLVSLVLLNTLDLFLTVIPVRVPTVFRGNPYFGCRGKIGMRSHEGTWKRGKRRSPQVIMTASAEHGKYILGAAVCYLFRAD